jgi:hypothetical protein
MKRRMPGSRNFGRNGFVPNEVFWRIELLQHFKNDFCALPGQGLIARGYGFKSSDSRDTFMTKQKDRDGAQLSAAFAPIIYY